MNVFAPFSSSALQNSLLVALQAGVQRLLAASRVPAFMKTEGVPLPFFALLFFGCELRKGVTLALRSGGC